MFKRIKDIFKTKRLKLAGLVGAAAIVAGTFTNHERDFPPFYSRKTGTSGGIAVSLVVDFQDGAKFYGPVIGLVNLAQDNSRIYGTPSLSLVSGRDATSDIKTKLSLIDVPIKKMIN